MEAWDLGSGCARSTPAAQGGGVTTRMLKMTGLNRSTTKILARASRQMPTFFSLPLEPSPLPPLRNDGSRAAFSMLRTWSDDHVRDG